MEQVSEIISASVPFMIYLIPTIFVISVLSCADMIVDHMVRLVRYAAKRYRL